MTFGFWIESLCVYAALLVTAAQDLRWRPWVFLSFAEVCHCKMHQQNCLLNSILGAVSAARVSLLWLYCCLAV